MVVVAHDTGERHHRTVFGSGKRCFGCRGCREVERFGRNPEQRVVHGRSSFEMEAGWVAGIVGSLRAAKCLIRFVIYTVGSRPDSADLWLPGAVSSPSTRRPILIRIIPPARAQRGSCRGRKDSVVSAVDMGIPVARTAVVGDVSDRPGPPELLDRYGELRVTYGCR